jgi:hypothetical protein
VSGVSLHHSAFNESLRRCGETEMLEEVLENSPGIGI